MKGLSSFVASVLLIAFTIAIGGILSVWITSLTKTQTSLTETQTSGVTKCSSADLEIISASPTNNKVVITHYGYGLKFYPVNVIFSDGTVNSTFAQRYGITAGNTTTLNVTFPTGVSWVKVSGSCEYGTSNMTIESMCRNSEDCWFS